MSMVYNPNIKTTINKKPVKVNTLKVKVHLEGKKKDKK